MKIILLLLLSLLTGCSATKHLDKSSSDPQKEEQTSVVPDIPYQVIENLIGTNDKPALIIYLHSNSGSGTDNKKQMTQVSVSNIGEYIKDNKISAYFLVPQCPADHEWDSRGSSAGYYLKAKELIDYFLDEKDIDESRIYICGASMGAMGAWRMLREYPNLFTAGIVSSGQAQFATPSLYTYLPLYITAGTEERSYEALKSFALQIKNAGGNVVFEEFEGMTHGRACDNACSAERLQWLFSQKKGIK
ncbi:MAG: hypothetical protein IJL22_01160 [Bacteroidales bacterium]|nr:hypothetical protein [Bacteroidales bacterium]